VALNAHADIGELERFDGLYDFVQVMGIDRIGRQGEPPDRHHKEIALIKALRERYPVLVIQVDGGVAPHPRELLEAGANRLIVGSAIVRARDPKAALEKLYTEIK
jgi:pentose-5-phosphate-3-epimerase